MPTAARIAEIAAITPSERPANRKPTVRSSMTPSIVCNPTTGSSASSACTAARSPAASWIGSVTVRSTT